VQAGNEILLRAILCLQNTDGALDWRSGEKISGLGRRPRDGSTQAVSVLQRHHVFPTDVSIGTRKGKLTTGEVFETKHDLVLNRCLIRYDTNKELQATPPSTVDKRGCKWSYVESHLIDRKALRDWRKFIKARADAVETSLAERVPKPGGASP
jgi:hypothetical protein